MYDDMYTYVHMCHILMWNVAQHIGGSKKKHALPSPTSTHFCSCEHTSRLFQLTLHLEFTQF